MSSNKVEASGVAPLKTTWFLKFQVHHVVANQIKWLVRPLFWCRNSLPNLVKWLQPTKYVGTLFPIQLENASHIPLLNGQRKNKCDISSVCCVQKTHDKSLGLINIPLQWRAFHVGNQSNNNRQAKTSTLEGTSFYHN
jgi:hypothetical protein